MSGIACVVVATGNRTQAYAQSFKDAAPNGLMPNANVARALAASLCTFAGTYDPVATVDQQQRATQVMGDFNDVAKTIDSGRLFTPREFAHADMTLVIFNRAAQFLIDEILANP